MIDYEKLIGVPLSDKDIINLVDGKANVITYKELQKYKTLDDALGEDNAFVLLYETEPNFGHWTCVFKENGRVNVFDSYGIYPDDEIKFVPKNFKKLNYRKFKYLTKLLYDSKYPVEYNEVPLQSDKVGVSTCGRWVATRLIMRDMCQDDFAKLFSQFDDPDLAVTYITGFI